MKGEEDKVRFSEIIDDVKEFADTKYNLAILKLVDKGSSIGATAVSWGIAFVFILLTFLFFCLSLAFFLSEIYNSYSIGFGLTAGIFLLISIILLILRKKVIGRTIKDMIIKEVFDKD